MLDDRYKGKIVLIATKCVNGDEDLAAGTAFKKLFEAATEYEWHGVRQVEFARLAAGEAPAAILMAVFSSEGMSFGAFIQNFVLSRQLISALLGSLAFVFWLTRSRFLVV